MLKNKARDVTEMRRITIFWEISNLGVEDKKLQESYQWVNLKKLYVFQMYQEQKCLTLMSLRTLRERVEEAGTHLV